MKQNLELRNTDGQLIFGKGAKAIQHEFLFNKGAGIIGCPHAKKMNLDPNLELYTHKKQLKVHPNAKCKSIINWTLSN